MSLQDGCRPVHLMKKRLQVVEEFYGRFCAFLKIFDYICRVNLLRERCCAWF